MDGSTASIIAIPVVVTISLAVWLIVVYYAASHPSWRHGAAARNAAPAHPDSSLRALPEMDDSTDRHADRNHQPAPDRTRAA